MGGSMHLKLDATNLPEHNANSNKPNSHSQPRWSGTRQGFILTDDLGKGRTNLNQAKHPNGGLGTKTCEPIRAEGTGDIIYSTKEIPLTIVSHSDGKCGDEQPHIRQDIPIMPPTMSEYAAPPTQLQELVGHSIACPSYPYADLYHGGVVPPYGPQSLVHPHCIGVHPARMALPLEMAEEPVYVNAKQYHGILRRRQSRAKAEVEKKVIKVRKPYLHESRHLHAMRRARGCGGRFLNTKKLDTDPSSNATPAEKGGEVSTSNLLSQLYLNSSSGARSNTSHNVIQSANTCVGHREATEFSGRQQSGTTVQQAFFDTNRKTYSNDNGWEYPRQQHERIVAHSHRALTIK